MEESREKDEAWPELLHLECKGCGRCVLVCPKDVLFLSKALNERGYHFAEYAGEGCTGCANCFYSCPEPYAIRIHRPERGTKQQAEQDPPSSEEQGRT